MLHLGMTRFFSLLKEYRRDPAAFSIDYQRRTPARLPDEVEAEINRELPREKELVDDPHLAICGCN